MKRGQSRGGKGTIKQVWVVKSSSPSSSSTGPSAPPPPHRPQVENYDLSNNSSTGTKGGLFDHAVDDLRVKSVPKPSNRELSTDYSHGSFTPLSVAEETEGFRLADILPCAADCSSNKPESSSFDPKVDVNFSPLSTQSIIKGKFWSENGIQGEQSVDASGKSNSRGKIGNSQTPSPGGDLGNGRGQTSHEKSYRRGSLGNSQISHSVVDSDIRHGQTSHEKSYSRGKLENDQKLHPGVDSGSRHGQASQEKSDSSGKFENSQNLHSGTPYDICCTRAGVQLRPALHVMNKERRNEEKRLAGEQRIVELRPGMVHLKRYLSIEEQVKIIEKCRELGQGPGGFYQPGYRDGATLSLKMMCLGKNWDPQTSKYDDVRPDDGAKPPSIPDEFSKLVQRAIQYSHDFLKKQPNIRNVEDVLPSMTPDICIVNFYTNTGRLGLHQDKDESRASLSRGLPVVSFSIGDSAVFVYGDERDIDKAEKVDLESGDVLIFGGDSRNVFHGVTTIKGKTASPVLTMDSNLREGRLNLTFRQY